MNNFEQWLEHYTKTHGPVLDLEKMEASVKQWKFDKITKEALAIAVSLPSFTEIYKHAQATMDKRAQVQAARNILSEATLNIETKPMTKAHIHQKEIA